MIKLDSKALGDVIDVTGDPGDVAIFYCVWQQRVWEDVFKHFATKADDGFITQISAVSKDIAEGKVIRLAANGDPFEKALSHAVKFCQQFMVIEKD